MDFQAVLNSNNSYFSKAKYRRKWWCKLAAPSTAHQDVYNKLHEVWGCFLLCFTLHGSRQAKQHQSVQEKDNSSMNWNKPNPVARLATRSSPPIFLPSTKCQLLHAGNMAPPALRYVATCSKDVTFEKKEKKKVLPLTFFMQCTKKEVKHSDRNVKLC